MKGLLLKDLYMTMKYCRTYLLIAVVFIAVSFGGGDSLIFIFYPCLFCGMIPVSLLGYDERSHWLQYSDTLPYTKGQIVSCKYLIGLMAQIAVLIVTTAAQAVRTSSNGTFELRDYIVLMLTIFIISLITSSVSLPAMFKLGVEKGRIAYYAAVGVICAACGAASSVFGEDFQEKIRLNAILPIILLIGIGIYALSWYMSVVFYKKRELK